MALSQNTHHYPRNQLSTYTEMTQMDMEAYAGSTFVVAVLNIFDQWYSLFDDEMLQSTNCVQDLKHFYSKAQDMHCHTKSQRPCCRILFGT